MDSKIKVLIANTIVYILFLLGFIFMWNSMQSAKTELEALKRSHSTIETKIDINKPLAEVEDREKTEYPKIDRDIDVLNKSIKKTNNEIKQLDKTKPTKEASYDKFKDKTFEEINLYWNNNPDTTTSDSSTK
jgi:hypothetical protein